MIVRPRPSLWQLFFVMRGSIVPRILPQIILVALVASVVVVAHDLNPLGLPSFGATTFGLVGIALSVFLAFRNNVSYDRWWEGRKLWGQLITVSRTLCRQSMLLIDGADQTHRTALLRMVSAFAAALAVHLRDEKTLPPNDILKSMSTALVAHRREGRLTDIEFQLLDRSVADMDAVLAGCERIKNTPVPLAYWLLMHRTAYLFCFLLPIGLADALEWATPVASALIAYTFFGLDAVADELEEPFGREPNDLAISLMSITIARHIADEINEPLPVAPEAIDYVLN